MSASADPADPAPGAEGGLAWPPVLAKDLQWRPPLPPALGGSVELSLRFVRPVRCRADKAYGLGFRYELVELDGGEGCVGVVTGIDDAGIVCPAFSTDDEGYVLDTPMMVQRGDIILALGTGFLFEEPELRIAALIEKAGEVDKLTIKLLRLLPGRLAAVVAFRVDAAMACELNERTRLTKAHSLHARELLLHHGDALGLDTAARMQYNAWLSEAHRGCGDINLSIRAAEAALELALAGADKAMQCEAEGRLSRQLIAGLDLEAAKSHLSAQSVLAEDLRDHQTLLSCYFHLASLPTLEAAVAQEDTAGVGEQMWSALVSSVDLLGTSLGLSFAEWKYKVTFKKDDAVDHLLQRALAAGTSAKKNGTLTPEGKYLMELAESLVAADICVIS